MKRGEKIRNSYPRKFDSKPKEEKAFFYGQNEMDRALNAFMDKHGMARGKMTNDRLFRARPRRSKKSQEEARLDAIVADMGQG